MKKIISLLAIIFFFFNLTHIKSQTLDSLTVEQQKKKDFNFNPRCSINPFVAFLQGKNPEKRETFLDRGGRVILGIEKPKFFFFYFDAFQEKFVEETFYNNKPSTFYKENNYVLEFGAGISGTLELFKGFGIDGEITIPLQTDFTMNVAVGFSWTLESKLLLLGVGNIAKTNKPGLFNPYSYFAVNISELFKKINNNHKPKKR